MLPIHEVEAVNSDTSDLWLNLQIEFGNMAIKMKNTQRKWLNQVSSDTT